MRGAFALVESDQFLAPEYHRLDDGTVDSIAYYHRLIKGELCEDRVGVLPVPLLPC